MTIKTKQHILAGLMVICLLITVHHWVNVQSITFRGMAYTVTFVFTVAVYSYHRWYC